MEASAGPHKLRVSNAGSGTFWAAYELRSYRHREGPNLDIQTEGYLLLWARNPQSISLCAKEGRELERQSGGRLTLKGVWEGRYSVTWRDTVTNEVVLRGEAETNGGRLVVDVPAITRSAAARINRAGP